ncbi:MAG: DEAD/DEAH box helicase [Rhodospirillales bacterium]|nr:DEAD/DEAH box helicase [Rhodospirillales bacterium]
MSFDDLGLSPEVLKAIADAGYTTPTPIQEQAVPYVLMGRDVLGCAQTGTGKTASFTLPMIDILASGRARARMPRSLIIEPTRELAAQVAENFEKYGKYNKLSMALLIGGSSFVEQEKKLDRGVDVLIATPGRLIDLFERGKILLADTKILVIDEADRMLDMGFIPDVERIVGLLPKIRQTLFFSATMPPEIRRLADAFLMNPKEVTVSPPASPAENVVLKLLRTSSTPKDKRADLRALIRAEQVASALIFCNRKRDVGILYRSLKRHDFSVAELHGDMAQPARTATLKKFKDGEVQLLVCSDVAARGLDIPKVSHVINFDVPVNAEDYIHRIGRTGRAGRSGRALTLASEADRKQLAAVTRMLGHKIEELTLDGSAPTQGDSAQGDAGRDGEAAAPRSRPGRGRRRGRGEQRREQRAQLASEPLAEPLPEPRPAPARPQPRVTRAANGKPRGDKRGRREQKPSSAPSQPTESFGDHTPAFMLREVKAAVSA